VALDQKEKLNRLRLIRTENVGPVTYHSLMRRYGSAATALEQVADLSARGGRSKPIRPPSLSRIEDEWERTHIHGAEFLFIDEAEFPPLLAALDPAPPLIITYGHRQLLLNRSIAMVGSRNASANARKLATQMAAALGEAGYAVVSGMARGIDTAAHRGALATGTCAVLAGGIDSIYPPENDDLYKEIADKGAIVSEMPFGHTGRARDFPRRNRLISGLALGVVVVEAALRSGSLISARFALEQSREVFAVPGSPLDPRCRGANSLIKQGAALVENAEDVIEVLETFTPYDLTEKEDHKDGDPHVAPMSNHTDEADLDKWRPLIIALMGPSPTEIDELIRQSDAPPGVMPVVLLELDLAGRLEHHPGQRVALNEE